MVIKWIFNLCKGYVKAYFGFGAKSVSPAPANSSGGLYPGIQHKILFKTQARNRDVAVAFISRCDQRIPHLMCKFNCAANLENISLRRINLSFLFIKPIDQQQMCFFLSCWFFLWVKNVKRISTHNIFLGLVFGLVFYVTTPIAAIRKGSFQHPS
ncbi:MAG: hypothetical protein EOM83_07415 [Clostridia bacterium]|nr:hypothetical protein [Clostridia bacterium]